MHYVAIVTLHTQDMVPPARNEYKSDSTKLTSQESSLSKDDSSHKSNRSVLFCSVLFCSVLFFKCKKGGGSRRQGSGGTFSVHNTTDQNGHVDNARWCACGGPAGAQLLRRRQVYRTDSVAPCRMSARESEDVNHRCVCVCVKMILVGKMRDVCQSSTHSHNMCTRFHLPLLRRISSMLLKGAVKSPNSLQRRQRALAWRTSTVLTSKRTPIPQPHHISSLHVVAFISSRDWLVERWVVKGTQLTVICVVLGWCNARPLSDDESHLLWH